MKGLEIIEIKPIKGLNFYKLNKTYSQDLHVDSLNNELIIKNVEIFRYYNSIAKKYLTNIQNVEFFMLPPKGFIYPHHDIFIPGSNIGRLHIVLTEAKDSYFYANYTPYSVGIKGLVFIVYPKKYIHHVINNSNKKRIHLVYTGTLKS